MTPPRAAISNITAAAQKNRAAVSNKKAYPEPLDPFMRFTAQSGFPELPFFYSESSIVSQSIGEPFP